MKSVAVCLLLACFSFQAFGYLAGIAIQTDKGTNMSVYVNGKLYNKRPGEFVRIKSRPGLFHVEVKVLNPHDKKWYRLRKDITVENGFEFYYRVVFPRGRKPYIEHSRKYPVYSQYFLNPALYNRHPTS